jgi:hypothetical protein
MVMTKEEIRTEARTPASPPIKGDGGGSVRSTASSCAASPPRKRGNSDVQDGERRWEGKLQMGTKNNVLDDQCEDDSYIGGR